MRHAVMYETSPGMIETSAGASVRPRQAWWSHGKRLELKRELIFLSSLRFHTSHVFPRHPRGVFIDVLGVSCSVLLIPFRQTFAQEN